jgi:hypothetical protein
MRIGPEDGRDAVHIALAPVTAADRLYPGQHIGFRKGNEMVGVSDQPLGIVDPFLPSFVETGERFWMFLYPNTISGLRHVWTHPSFMPETPQYTKEESEKWLREFCRTADCPSYEVVIAAAVGDPVSPVDGYKEEAYENDGDYLFFSGRDAHSSIPSEFWDHVQNLTGKEIPSYKRAKAFSCSC